MFVSSYQKLFRRQNFERWSSSALMSGLCLETLAKSSWTSELTFSLVRISYVVNDEGWDWLFEPLGIIWYLLEVNFWTFFYCHFSIWNFDDANIKMGLFEVVDEDSGRWMNIIVLEPRSVFSGFDELFHNSVISRQEKVEFGNTIIVLFEIRLRLRYGVDVDEFCRKLLG